jgi:hypothetical protein
MKLSPIFWDSATEAVMTCLINLGLTLTRTDERVYQIGLHLRIFRSGCIVSGVLNQVWQIRHYGG